MRISLVFVIALAATTLAAEDVVTVQTTVFDAPEETVVKKEDLDGHNLEVTSKIRKRSACQIKLRSGDDATLFVSSGDGDMNVKVRCDLDGEKIKYQTRWLDQDDKQKTGLFAVTGTCRDGDTALYKAKSATTGRIDYFYLTFKKEPVPAK